MFYFINIVFLAQRAVKTVTFRTCILTQFGFSIAEAVEADESTTASEALITTQAIYLSRLNLKQ